MAGHKTELDRYELKPGPATRYCGSTTSWNLRPATRKPNKLNDLSCLTFLASGAGLDRTIGKSILQKSVKRFIHNGSKDWKWFNTLAKLYEPVFEYSTWFHFIHSNTHVLLTLSWTRFQTNNTLIFSHGPLNNVAWYKHLFWFKAVFIDRLRASCRVALHAQLFDMIKVKYQKSK